MGSSLGLRPILSLIRVWPSRRDEEARMTDRLSPTQFHEAEGVEDWRVLGDGACAYFRDRIVRGQRPARAGDQRAAGRSTTTAPTWTCAATA